MPKVVPEAGPALTNNKGRNLPDPLPVPTRATADPDDSTVAGSLRSTGDQASSDSDLSREDVADSDMDTASGDCITCLDTDEVTVWTTQKKYQKRVRVSCRLSKGSLWTDAQLERIGESHQAMWGHSHESIPAEQDCALAEDHNSFEICRMMVRTDQLLCIATATDSQIYTRDLDAKARGQVKTLVLLLKQYHAHYYHFYEKGMTRAMVGPQGLHLSNAFRYFNVSSSVGLKSFSPVASNLGATLKWYQATWGKCITDWPSLVTSIMPSPACLCRASWNTTQDVRPNVQKNAQKKKDVRLKSHTRRNQRHGSRKKLPKVSLSWTDESCRVKRCLTPSVKFCWWTWVDPPLSSS